MANRTKELVLGQVQSECKKLDSSEGLPFREVLAEERILEALQRSGVVFRDRVYTPVVTLWAFLSQVLSTTSSSCQNAVSRVLADRVARKQHSCSADHSSYCQARCRLPDTAIIDLARSTGRDLHRQAQAVWLWMGRHVLLLDGSTASMADTEANQKEYPQSRSQKAGLGFPILRFVVLLSLAVGTTLECAIGPCRGKNTGEQSLFRQMWEVFQAGDIVLADRLYDAYRDIALLKARGVDSVFGKKQTRRCDFRTGRKLGRDDHVVVWEKPKFDASRFSSREEWESLPEEMEIREVRVTVRRKGFKTRSVVIVTTLLEEKYSGKALTDLFAQRWNCELDLRSIKRALGMHHLKCKTPEMVRKELWTYLLAYNLIRVRMAQAAAVHEVQPRTLSFTAAKNHIDNFARPLQTAACNAERTRIEAELLKAIATNRVGKRPGRKEPRAVKKRQQKYKYLTKPRTQARKGLPA
jgi:hypothetical protein